MSELPPRPAARKGTASGLSRLPNLPFAPRVPSRLFPDEEAISPSVLKAPHTTAHATSADLVTTGKTATLEDVQIAYAAPAVPSPSNALGDPTQNLECFSLPELAQFTKERCFSTSASRDIHLFYVGRDDVHDILKYVLSRVTTSLFLNMFGYDDSELNNIVMEKVLDPSISVLITLDSSQAGSVHEKALIAADEAYNLAAFNTHFAIGTSATHQISHTKGFVADGRVACEGSTNWSTSGEGTFVIQGQPGGPGYQAQNNTQSVITDADTVIRFGTELIAEHMTVVAAAKAGKATTSLPLPDKNTPAAQALFNQVRALDSPGLAMKKPRVLTK